MTTFDIYEEYRMMAYDPSRFNHRLYEFMNRPTLRHARKLLSSFGIPQPLKTELQTPERPRRSRPNSPQKGGSPPSPLIRELLYLDTLHDLLEVHKPTDMCDAIGSSYEVPPQLKRMFLASDLGFTKAAADYLCDKTEIRIRSCDMDQESRTAFDGALLDSLIDSHDITFVLDNVINAIKTVGGILGEATLGCLCCAYVLVLCANLKRLNFLMTDTITLYDGLFLRMDGDHVERFLVLFLKSLRRATSAITVEIRPHDILSIGFPVRFSNALGVVAEFTKKAGEDAIVFEGRSYKIAPQNILPLATDATFPHSKQAFRHNVETQGNGNKDLWYLNFLRDAFKADVAIDMDAVYITHDRLAYLYYLLIGGKKGVLIAIEHTSSVKFKYTVSK